MRSFSTFSRALFNKKPSAAYNLVNNVAAAAENSSQTVAVPGKWKPTHGDSFRSFAEYRLKVVHQLPLTRAKVGRAR